ncbi:hypothetical protein NOR_05178 [Metarhizium rileyi]|uniref:Uncharacterized protein n=1 Tax=Metarhizium rileyi (strain RCEF 4871) TaxID=1649241 RepID=A0A167CWT6_METRR|nr:hypothetical protein NOR_05178 [Metarhizium rileyi RCEF 4871]
MPTDVDGFVKVPPAIASTARRLGPRFQALRLLKLDELEERRRDRANPDAAP